jgi:RNA polymerase sigma factor (sigma-70 family)
MRLCPVNEFRARSAIAAVPSIGRAAHVERAARDADATQDLFERYSGQIFGFCVNRLGSRDEAEDALQSTFLNVHRALQRGVTPEAEIAWLYKIAHNVCLTRRRSTRRRGHVESPSDLAAVQDVLPAPSREAPDDLIRLTDALEQMPDNQRRAILMREWQGLSYHEIADELNLSQSAVETLLFRARRTLASNLDSEDEQPRRFARVRRAVDVGTLLAAVKGLFEGGAAVKVAAIAIAASGAAVAATDPPGPPSKSAPPTQAVTSVAQAAQASATAAPVLFQATAPTESAPVVESPAGPEEQAPVAKTAAGASQRPATLKVKDEPKATPPGHAKKQAAAVQAHGAAGKAKKPKRKASSSTADREPPPSHPAAPAQQNVVAAPAPVEGAPAAHEEVDKGPKK